MAKQFHAPRMKVVNRCLRMDDGVRVEQLACGHEVWIRPPRDPDAAQRACWVCFEEDALREEWADIECSFL